VDLRAPDWDAQMATWSANLRKSLRKAERKLVREHGLRYRLASDPRSLHADLDLLFALHDASRPEGSSKFRVDESFHRDFAALALERDWLRLWLLEADGDAVAAELVYRFAGVDASYQSGRDPDWEHSSVGTVVMAHAMRSALEEDVREYRLLRGHEAYKYRFANRDPGVETIVVPCHTLAAGAVVARRAMPERLGVPLRRRVRR
jgi:CelD/BcsL family acetyltransferase involved in cellulose biosynthesis